MPIGRVIAMGSNPTIPSNHRQVPNVFGINTSSAKFSFQGGQSVIFAVRNLNIIGTTVKIENTRVVLRNRDDFWRHIFGNTYTVTDACIFIVLPLMTALVQWTIFGAEPMGWKFSFGTDSDAHLVGMTAYSTWISGMAPNR